MNQQNPDVTSVPSASGPQIDHTRAVTVFQEAEAKREAEAQRAAKQADTTKKQVSQQEFDHSYGRVQTRLQEAIKDPRVDEMELMDRISKKIEKELAKHNRPSLLNRMFPPVEPKR